MCRLRQALPIPADVTVAPKPCGAGAVSRCRRRLGCQAPARRDSPLRSVRVCRVFSTVGQSRRQSRISTKALPRLGLGHLVKARPCARRGNRTPRSHPCVRIERTAVASRQHHCQDRAERPSFKEQRRLGGQLPAASRRRLRPNRGHGRARPLAGLQPMIRVPGPLCRRRSRRKIDPRSGAGSVARRPPSVAPRGALASVTGAPTGSHCPPCPLPRCRQGKHPAREPAPSRVLHGRAFVPPAAFWCATGVRSAAQKECPDGFALL